jgi:signal transduction histidine kinase
MDNLIDNTIKSTRKIYSELKPALLEHFGISEAIKEHSKRFQDRSEIKSELEIDEKIELDENRSIALFRIFQEALANVRWHSQATKVKVRLMEKGKRLNLIIKDDGLGVTEEKLRNHESFGLIGMRERALYLGGKLSIKGAPGKGTTVKVTIPLQISLTQ